MHIIRQGEIGFEREPCCLHVHTQKSQNTKNAVTYFFIFLCQQTNERCFASISHCTANRTRSRHPHPSSGGHGGIRIASIQDSAFAHGWHRSNRRVLALYSVRQTLGLERRVKPLIVVRGRDRGRGEHLLNHLRRSHEQPTVQILERTGSGRVLCGTLLVGPTESLGAKHDLSVKVFFVDINNLVFVGQHHDIVTIGKYGVLWKEGLFQVLFQVHDFFPAPRSAMFPPFHLSPKPNTHIYYVQGNTFL